jgi:hypothetical protein
VSDGAAMRRDMLREKSKHAMSQLQRAWRWKCRETPTTGLDGKVLRLHVLPRPSLQPSPTSKLIAPGLNASVSNLFVGLRFLPDCAHPTLAAPTVSPTRTTRYYRGAPFFSLSPRLLNFRPHRARTSDFVPDQKRAEGCSKRPQRGRPRQCPRRGAPRPRRHLRLRLRQNQGL